jgi:hypothetical protein
MLPRLATASIENRNLVLEPLTHFTRYLAPKWLVKHEPMVASAEACVGGDAIYPPGQAVSCDED